MLVPRVLKNRDDVGQKPEVVDIAFRRKRRRSRSKDAARGTPFDLAEAKAEVAVMNASIGSQETAS